MTKAHNQENLKKREVYAQEYKRHPTSKVDHQVGKKKSECDDSGIDLDEIEEQRFEDEGGCIIEDEFDKKRMNEKKK